MILGQFTVGLLYVRKLPGNMKNPAVVGNFLGTPWCSIDIGLLEGAMSDAVKTFHWNDGIDTVVLILVCMHSCALNHKVMIM